MAEEQQQAVARANLEPESMDFSRSGFLNYIIRYGGGVGPKEDHPIPFADLRKFVLDHSDTSTFAKEFFTEKCFSYVYRERNEQGWQADSIAMSPGKEWGQRGLPAEEARRAAQALRCPPFLKVLPIVEIINDNTGKVIASNSQQTPVANNVKVIIKNIEVKKLAKKAMGGTGTNMRGGRMTVEFISANKKTEILKAIADPANKNSLGWFFDVQNEYRVILRNEPKNNVFIGPRAGLHKKFYKSLTEAKVNFKTTTIKYSLDQWKPHQNRVTFTIEFALSTKDRDAMNKSDEPSPPDAPPDAEAGAALLRKSSLITALLTKLEQNRSLFSYSFLRKKQGHVRDAPDWLYRFARTTAQVADTTEATAATAEQDNKDYESRGHGVFFLFRSLLVAAVQTYYVKETTLDSDIMGDIFFDENHYANMFLGIHEDIVPTELRGAPWWDRSDDVRNTFESITVDLLVFTQFMDELMTKHPRVTFSFFVEELFNKLIPMVLKRNIRIPTGALAAAAGVKGDRNASFVGSATLDWYLDVGRIDDPATARKAEFLTINKTKAAKWFDTKLKNKRNKITLRKNASTMQIVKHAGNMRVRTALWGSLRFKMTNGLFLQTALNTAYETGDEGFVMLMAGAVPADTQALATQNRQNKAKNATALDGKKPRELLTQGIVRVNWYDRKNPQANADFRFVTKGHESPFKFSMIDDKYVEQQRRAQAGIEPFFKNIYNCEFSTMDYLGIEPYTVQFYFPPEFFGFDPPSDTLGIGDAFGLAGVYVVSEVTITYSTAKPSFLTKASLVMNRVLQVREPPSPSGKKAPAAIPQEPKEGTPPEELEKLRAAALADQLAHLAKYDQDVTKLNAKIKAATKEFRQESAKTANDRARIATAMKRGNVPAGAIKQRDPKDIQTELNQLTKERDEAAKRRKAAKKLAALITKSQAQARRKPCPPPVNKDC